MKREKIAFMAIYEIDASMRRHDKREKIKL
jgi:hypothetical protein